jgi:DNA polymerase I-like protein with 3'-5' exonuclease and polymerase domains
MSTAVASTTSATDVAIEGNKERLYINSLGAANRAVAEIVGMLESGRFRKEVGLDVETSPLPGLEGYPGTQPKDEGDGFERATKDAYLRFSQKVWRAGFSPFALNALGVYLPKKTTSGKEGDISAADAWSAFLVRLEALMATPEGQAKLEAARWTQESASAYLGELTQGAGRALYEQRNALEAELREKQALADAGRKVVGIKKLEGQLKKVQAALDENTAEAMFVLDNVSPRVEQPVDLRLLVHVVRVGVEGRVYLTKEGRNRLDPVQPGLDPRTSTVFLVQFTLQEKGTKRLVSYIFNTHQVDIKVLLPLLRMKKVKFLGANIKFDLRMLMHHAGYAPRDVFCTRVGSRMLYLGLRLDHSLKATAKRFCKLDLSKEVRNDFVGRRYAEPTEEMLAYAYTDTEVLPALYDAMVARAEKFGQVKLIHDFSNLSWITARWEYEGFLIDTDRWWAINREAAKSRDEIARQLEELLLGEQYATAFSNGPVSGEDDAELEGDFDDESEDGPAVDVRKNVVIRISQTKLVLERLERVLGIGELGQHCPNGKASLSKDARSALERAYRDRHYGETHPFFKLYALWTKLAKQVSTYGRRFLWYIHPLTGRVHPQFHIAGTDTGRYSSTGPNFLNIPAAKEEGDPDFRGAFEAPEGHLLLGGDLEAMEMRIAGDISRDPAIQKMVLSGADAHKFSAASMFHLRRGDVREPTWQGDEVPYGTSREKIEVLVVPRAYTDQQLIELAASPEVQAKVTKVTRTIAKMVGFLWLFRGTAFTLAQRTGMTVEVCEDFFKRFETVYDKMSGHMNAIAESVHTNVIEGDDGKRYAWSEGYGGIRRWVTLPHNPEGWGHTQDYYQAAREYKRAMRRAQRELCNLPCQGGNAIITAEALLKIVERGYRFGIYPWLSIYDEVICVFPETANPTQVKALLESAMLETADSYMQFVPAGFEADLKKVSRVWVKS